MRRQLFIFFISLFWLLTANGQSINEKDFVRHTLKSGLTDNYVTSLEQDDEGYIWIGTDAGLNRFDGYSFQRYHSSSRSLPLLSSNIWNLKRPAAGKIGILTKSGLQILNTTNFRVNNFVIDTDSAFSTYKNDVWDLKILADKTVAVTSATGFYVFDTTGKLQYRYDAYHANDVDKKRILFGREIFSLSRTEYLVYVNGGGIAIYNSAQKKLTELKERHTPWEMFLFSPGFNEPVWITKYQLSEQEFIFINILNDTIYYYDHSSKKVVPSRLPFSCKRELNYQSHLFPYDDSHFVLNAGTQGIYQLTIDRQTGRISCDPKKYFVADKINSALYDRQGRLWLGTLHGLLQQQLNPAFLQTHIYKPAIFKDDQDGTFLKAIRYNDKLYVARFSRNTGLIVFDTTTMQPARMVQFYGENNKANEVSSMQMYYPDTLWICTTNGLLWVDTKTYNYGKVIDDKRFPAKLDEFHFMGPVNEHGDAWMCKSLGGVIGRYHVATRRLELFTDSTNPSVPFKRVKMVANDSYGNAWIGGHSLARWNYATQHFDTLMSVYAGPHKFNDNILVLQPDDKGSLWFYNAENALLQYHIKERRYDVYTTEQGLPADKIDALSPGLNNSIWMATRTSLVHLDINSKKMLSFNLPDSVNIKKFGSTPIYLDTAAGWGYILAKNEIVKFPIKANAPRDLSNDLFVTSLVINNRKVIYETGKPLQLSSTENNVAINFTVIDYEQNDYAFAYKMKRSDEWMNLDGQRNLILTDLRAGKYEIFLRATGKSGMEKIATVRFTIRPPFWKTIWFYALLILMIAFVIFYIYHRRVSGIRQRAELDRQLASIEMKALHTQMNPHFIFNCLNSIKKMILDNDNNKASRYLSKFAQLIRITLNQSTRSFISLRNTIDYLERYLEMEQIRTDQFAYKIEVDEELNPEETYIPPMLIQPFIENAIWHAARGENEKTQIHVQFSRMDEDLVCQIMDNGIGIDSSLKKKDEKIGHHSLGIANVRQRMQVLNEKYNLHARLTIEDRGIISNNTVTGTLVTLLLSIKTTDV